MTDNLAEILNNISDIIVSYRDTDLKDITTLNTQLQALSGWLFSLEAHRVMYHEKYEKILYEQMSDKKSGVKAKNYADVKVPELYLCRRVTESGNNVLNTMHKNINYTMFEMKQSKSQV